jgi:YidC/Oxa1 family membrane protein insertase
MFTTLIVQPIFNLLVLIYALLPGHNFGLSIIIFTVVIRLLMWPLVRKQLHQAKAMRALQPELKRIKAAAKGNRQQESALLMELYKERGINPFSSIGVLLLQLPILIGLYSGLRRIIVDPHHIISFSYPVLHNLPWLKELAGNIHRFDASLFGVVDLTRPALNKGGGIYWPAMLIVAGSAAAQYFQSKQLMPQSKDSRKLRHILKDAGGGKQADQSEVNAAIGRSTRYFIPAMIFFLTVNLASALSLYWLVGGATAFLQQARVLRRDETELEAVADKTSRKVIEGEVIEKKPKVKNSKQKRKSGSKKRRK